jgi:hypothetical protein
VGVMIEESQGSLSEVELTDLERKLSIILPEQYRQFLLHFNGGRPSPSVFRFKKASGKYSDSMVDWFLSIYDGEYDNFESYFETYKLRHERLPADLVPIAHDPGGNLICIAVTGVGIGAVYFWDHEHEADRGVKPTRRNIYHITYNFDQFLEGLSEK